MAARDVIGHIKGTLDTPEKYEEHRSGTAERARERMKDRDLGECRNCHDFKTMDPAKQKDRSVTKHEGGAIEDGKTCIDCHKGSRCCSSEEAGPGASSASCHACTEPQQRCWN